MEIGTKTCSLPIYIPFRLMKNFKVLYREIEEKINIEHILSEHTWLKISSDTITNLIVGYFSRHQNDAGINSSTF